MITFRQNLVIIPNQSGTAAGFEAGPFVGITPTISGEIRKLQTLTAAPMLIRFGDYYKPSIQPPTHVDTALDPSHKPLTSELIKSLIFLPTLIFRPHQNINACYLNPLQFISTIAP